MIMQWLGRESTLAIFHNNFLDSITSFEVLLLFVSENLLVDANSIFPYSNLLNVILKLMKDKK